MAAVRLLFRQDWHTLDEGPLTDRRASIRSFAKEIAVTQQEIQLNYTLPLPPDGLTEERVEVLPIVRYGGRYRTRTCDPLRVNCKTTLFSIVFEAKLLFCACPYYSLKNPFLQLALKNISAKLVPYFLRQSPS